MTKIISWIMSIRPPFPTIPLFIGGVGVKRVKSLHGVTAKTATSLIL